MQARVQLLALSASLAVLATSAVPAVPDSVLLHNAADAGLTMPIMGLGTAGGGTDHGFAVHPECWASCKDAQCLEPMPGDGCGNNTVRAIIQFFNLGGRRLDDANGYRNQDAVGRAIRDGPLKREDIFLMTKVGSYLSMGYGETWNQTAIILQTMGVSYIDHLMMHWPSCATGGGCGPSSDPFCNYNTSTYDEKACRLSSWRALLDIWRAGLARSVGVSNFNVSHLDEIKAAGLTLPSGNQVSFNLYHSVAERDLLNYCNVNGIVFNSWVPFARTDSWVQQPPCATDPTLDVATAAMAAKYGATGAQLQLAWQVSLGIAPNPRSQNLTHVAENLAALELAGRISQADSDALWTAPQSICAPPACTNPVFAGCVNNGK